MISFPKIIIKRISLGTVVNIDFFLSLGETIPTQIKYPHKGTFKILVAEVRNSKILSQSQSSKNPGRYLYNLYGQGPFKRDSRIVLAKAKNIFLRSETIQNSRVIPFHLDSEDGGAFSRALVSNPPFLSYVFVPFIEKGTKKTFGMPTIRIVKNKGKVVKAAHAINAPTKKKYINSIVHELLIIEQLKNTKFSAVRSSSIVNKNEPYIGDISLSRDRDGQCRFMFGIDFLKMLTHSSRYPWVFINPAAESQLLEFSKILSFEVLRRKAPTTKTSTDLFVDKINTSMTEKQGPIEVIASSKDHHFRDFRPAIASKKDALGKGTAAATGIIKEMQLVSSSRSIRTFTGVDLSANEIRGGAYQYGVKISVDDPTVAFLQQKRKDLLRAIDTLLTYYAIFESTAQAHNVYSVKTREFSDTFIKYVNTDNIIRSIEVYVSILNIFSARPLKFDSNLPVDLFKLICPINGLPENILKIIGIMELLLRKIEQYSDVGYSNKSPKSAQQGGEAPFPQNRKPKLISKKYIKWFDNLFDNRVSKKIGYHFINPSKEHLSGPSIISWEAYDSMTSNQVAKLFGEGKTYKINKAFKFELSSTKNSFLSPIKIGLGEEQPLDLSSDKTSDFYDVDKYNYILSEISRFNDKEPNIGHDLLYKRNEKIEVNEQKLKDSLIDLFASKGCTIDNIGSFSYNLNQKKNKTSNTTSVVDKDNTSNVDAVLVPIIQRQTHHKLLESDGVTPSRVLTKIAENYSSHNGVYNPEKYNMNSTKNFKYEALNQVAVDSLPNQIKGLLLLHSKKKSNINVDLSKLSGDDRERFGFLYMNFMNLMKVEVLTGYKNGNIMEPIYQKLKAGSLPKGIIFARLSQYKNELFNISEYKYDFPIYNQGFIIDNSKGTAGMQDKITIPNKDPKEGVIQKSIPENMVLSEIAASKNMKIVRDMINSEHLTTYSYGRQRPARTPSTTRAPRPSPATARTSARSTPITRQASPAGGTTPRGGDGGGGYRP